MKSSLPEHKKSIFPSEQTPPLAAAPIVIDLTDEPTGPEKPTSNPYLQSSSLCSSQESQQLLTPQQLAIQRMLKKQAAISDMLKQTEENLLKNLMSE